MSPKIYKTDPNYFDRLLQLHNIKHRFPEIPETKVSTHIYFDGFTDYNYLVDIDLLLSKEAVGTVFDRLGIIKMPYQITAPRPWTNPVSVPSLEQVFEQRVHYIESLDNTINILYSGGIDSTVAMVAILKHGNLSKYRVIYTKESIAENPYFYIILQNTPGIELVELTEDMFANNVYDGVFVNGNGGDTLNGQMEYDFFSQVGIDRLTRPWQEYFSIYNNDIKFLNFCEELFSRAFFSVNTLFEARWWYYTIYKSAKYRAVGWLQPNDTLNNGKPAPVGFFEFYEYEHFNALTLDKIIPTGNYSSYKKLLKDYIFDFDQNVIYRDSKSKEVSSRLSTWWVKHSILQSREYMAILDNGERIATDNMPLITEREYRKKYGNRLDYLFTQK
ncbi:hypothetical protein UFOVP190_164 [uncultured Caudovirales phage]|uniref:Asparagine synthase n=1 Tax=uncultured Caudovirales phage TaxID=2100421 RepID=A0A6J7WLZ2_9CAUD|nr:hypothetical protein UFOVP190_164 [uncultured Caudovirales phage]